jgi:hypothetical protein
MAKVCWIFPIAVGSLFMVACGDDGAAPPPPPAAPAPAPPVPPPAPPAPAGTVVGPAGGTVTAGGATLVIPAGALSQDVTITVDVTSPAATLPESASVSGMVFDFKPDGTTFAIPAMLTLPFVATPSAGQRAMISWLDETSNRWVDLGGTLANGAVTAPVSHFTGFAARSGVERGVATRSWNFISLNGFLDVVSDVGGVQTGGVVSQSFDFGASPLLEQLGDGSRGRAVGEVFSSETGATFWADVEAPNTHGADRTLTSGAISRLDQLQSFVKRSPNATLQIVVSRAYLWAADHNGSPQTFECGRSTDGLPDTQIFPFCQPLISRVNFESWVYRDTSPAGPVTLLGVGGFAGLRGFNNIWQFDAFTFADSMVPLWTADNFGVDAIGGRNPTVALLDDIVVGVDLSALPVCPAESAASQCADSSVKVYSRVQAEVYDWRGRESGVYAYVRDPVTGGGDVVLATGLESYEDPAPVSIPAVPMPAPCAVPDPAAGAIEFAADAYSSPEGAALVTPIVVTRTGGSRGAVAARVLASGGTAVAGTDYEPLAASVFFGDGDAQPRAVTLEPIDNQVRELEQTVNLALTQPGGCATIGARAAATFTIVDDDPTPAPPRFTVGGTVVGLIPPSGGNLVLENHTGLFLEITANGPFTFTSLPSTTGTPYFVRVFNQPRNALGFQSQQCTVANSSGTFGDANVTNVVVTCEDL